MSKILVIEDDKTKIEKLRAFFHEREISIRESYHGGVVELINNAEEYDFLILDMTIPLWERGNNDLGGNYEQFGGERVLREMKRKKIHVPTILFTMFDIFPTSLGNLTFDEIDDSFKIEFLPFYRGAVFYSSNEENWKVELSTLISQIERKYE